MLAQVLVESARTTAMLFTILIGALIFANFVNFTSMPEDLKDYVEQFQLHPMTVIVMICVIYVLLGTAMEELSMILLTVPVLFPLVVHLGFDPLWFGILVVVVVEIGLISPPVGMNIFVLRTLLPNVSTGTIYRGVMPVRRCRRRAARHPDLAADPVHLAADTCCSGDASRPAERPLPVVRRCRFMAAARPRTGRELIRHRPPKPSSACAGGGEGLAASGRTSARRGRRGGS